MDHWGPNLGIIVQGVSGELQDHKTLWSWTALLVDVISVLSLNKHLLKEFCTVSEPYGWLCEGYSGISHLIVTLHIPTVLRCGKENMVVPAALILRYIVWLFCGIYDVWIFKTPSTKSLYYLVGSAYYQ